MTKGWRTLCKCFPGTEGRCEGMAKPESECLRRSGQGNRSRELDASPRSPLHDACRCCRRFSGATHQRRERESIWPEGGGRHRWWCEGHFQIEDRYFPNTGTTDPAYPFFNTAFVGLQSTAYGKLTMGRQLNPLSDAVLNSFVTNPWLPTFYQFRPEVMMAQGVWTSNMVKYAARWQYFTAEASYAFGGNAGAFGAGSQIGASLLYLPGAPLRLGVAYLDARDAVNGSAHFKSWIAGGSYTFDSTTFIAGWAVNRQDTGFQGNFPNGPFSAPELTEIKFNTFSSRHMFYGGISQQLGIATHLSANVWRTIHTGKTQPNDGNATQFQLLADYNWSKRTDTYVEIDYSLYRGGMVGAQFQGVNAPSSAFGTTQLGVVAGLRHMF